MICTTYPGAIKAHFNHFRRELFKLLDTDDDQLSDIVSKLCSFLPALVGKSNENSIGDNNNNNNKNHFQHSWEANVNMMVQTLHRLVDFSIEGKEESELEDPVQSPSHQKREEQPPSEHLLIDS